MVSETFRSPVRAFPASLNKQFSSNRRYSLPLTHNVRRPIPVYPFQGNQSQSPVLDTFSLPPSADPEPSQLSPEDQYGVPAQHDSNENISIKLEGESQSQGQSSLQAFDPSFSSNEIISWANDET